MANIIVKRDEAAVVAELCRLVEQEAREAVAATGTFHLGLSGGSLAGFLCKGLPKVGAVVDDEDDDGEGGENEGGGHGE